MQLKAIVNPGSNDDSLIQDGNSEWTITDERRKVIGSMQQQLQPTAFQQNNQPNQEQGQAPDGGANGAESALLDEILTDIQLLSREGEVMRRPSTSSVFFTVVSSVVLSALAPYTFSPAITEVLIPTAASIIAVCATAAEFQGKDATADAKEVAAVALAQAARAEAYLARAEKAKAVMPAMVGVSATAATLCLIFPALTASGVTVNPLFIGLCPIVSTAAAAWGAAAGVETLAQGLLALGKVSRDRIISVREASTPSLRKKVLQQRASSIAKATIPSLLIGLLMPGEFVFRSIVAAAVAGAAAAYNLAEAETIVAEVTLKVAYISKAAAQADVFANKAAAESSVLPFTSAIAGVSTALAAALVEVQPGLAGLIPTFGAVASGVAAAASARSELDATSTRLAFRDSGIRKIAPLATVPNLFQNVVPQLLESMLRTGVDITVDSLKKLADNSAKAIQESIGGARGGGQQPPPPQQQQQQQLQQQSQEQATGRSNTLDSAPNGIVMKGEAESSRSSTSQLPSSGINSDFTPNIRQIEREGRIRKRDRLKRFFRRRMENFSEFRSRVRGE